MSLVNYSESDSDTDVREHDQPTIETGGADCAPVTEPNTSKRRACQIATDDVQRTKPPPLPSSLLSLYAINTRVSSSDDPSLHAGRHRQIPHVRGNWPSHIYLEWFPTKTEFSNLKKLILKAQGIDPILAATPDSSIHSFIQSTLGVQLPLHVSLSAPLSLNTFNKDDFEADLIERLGNSGIQALRVHPLGLDWVSNSDRTRFFLVLRLSKPTTDQLNELLKRCNGICREFELPTLYDENDDIAVTSGTSRAGMQTPCEVVDKSGVFHISIAWTLQEPSGKAKQELQTIMVAELGLDEIVFSSVKLKIGSSISEIALVPDL